MKSFPLFHLGAAAFVALASLSRAAEVAPIPLTDLKGNLNAARWTPDSKTLVIAGARGLFVVDPAIAKVTRWVESQTSFESLALSLDGRLAAVGQHDGNLAIYTLADGTVRTTIPAKEFNAGEAPAVAGFSPDGKTLVGGGKGAGVWSVADGKLVKSIPFPRPLQKLALSPDGKLLLAASRDGGGGSLYDVATGALARQQPETKASTPKDFNPNPQMINDLGFMPDGKKFYAGGFMSKGLYFYTGADGKQSNRLTLEAYQNGSLSQDGSKLAWGSWNTLPNAKNAITITDTKTGAALQQIPTETMTHFSALSPDGATLFVLPQGGGSAVLYRLGKVGR